MSLVPQSTEREQQRSSANPASVATTNIEDISRESKEQLEHFTVVHHPHYARELMGSERARRIKLGGSPGAAAPNAPGEDTPLQAFHKGSSTEVQLQWVYKVPAVEEDIWASAHDR